MKIGLVCTRGVGPARGGRLNNEDNYLVGHDGKVCFRSGKTQATRRSSGQGTLLVVADGMGGHQHGELAASAAVQAFGRLYDRGWAGSPELTLHRFALKAHSALRDRVESSGTGELGTTVVCAWIIEKSLHWVNVGDSRLYLLRNRTLFRLTFDHTRGEMAHRNSQPEPPDPTRLTQSFIYGSRNLGDNSKIRIDKGKDTGTKKLLAGDRLLLCTDGLSRYLPDKSIQEVMRTVFDTSRCAEALAELAMSRGSTDNITALVVAP